MANVATLLVISMSFGFLTLATRSDYFKAIGLALSLRISNPGTPIAVACCPKVGQQLEPYFDYVIEEDSAVRGFAHKVHLDRYSPFEETFFFDADVLVFRRLSDIIENWRSHSYTACGNYVLGGVSPFGLDRTAVLKKIGRDRLVHIDGAGHAFFRKPACDPLFVLARDITANYREYAGPIRYADEDVMDIAMTILDMEPMPHGEFFSRHLSARKGTLVIDALSAKCEFECVLTGDRRRPYMMHFAADEAPFTYAMQLYKLLNSMGSETSVVWFGAIKDFYQRELRIPLAQQVKKFLGLQ
jgi:hypothetical protein